MGLQPGEQVPIGGYRVDFHVDGCLVVEFDGQGKYRLTADPAVAHWAEKCRPESAQSSRFDRSNARMAEHRGMGRGGRRDAASAMRGAEWA